MDTQIVLLLVLLAILVLYSMRSREGYLPSAMDSGTNLPTLYGDVNALAQVPTSTSTGSKRLYKDANMDATDAGVSSIYLPAVQNVMNYQKQVLDRSKDSPNPYAALEAAHCKPRQLNPIVNWGANGNINDTLFGLYENKDFRPEYCQSGSGAQGSTYTSSMGCAPNFTDEYAVLALQKSCKDFGPYSPEMLQ